MPHAKGAQWISKWLEIPQLVLKYVALNHGCEVIIAGLGAKPFNLSHIESVLYRYFVYLAIGDGLLLKTALDHPVA